MENMRDSIYRYDYRYVEDLVSRYAPADQSSEGSGILQAWMVLRQRRSMIPVTLDDVNKKKRAKNTLS